MNKAFVKESEDQGDRCPKCGSVGQSVLQVTLEAHLTPQVRSELSKSAFFCPFPTCEVAYFDQFERTVSVKALTNPVYLKNPDAPICPCFGLTCDEIEADVREGVVTRVKAHLQRAQSSDARCQTMSADGQSCIAAVQRYFMQLRGE